MFKDSFKTEFRKAITNKMAVIDLLIVLTLSIYHAITVIINYQDFYEFYISRADNENLMITSESLFNRWLALDVASFPTSTFYFMIPLIVVLPYGWSLVSEIRSGYTKNIIVRTTRKNYFLTKYAANFLSAVLVTIIPLAVNFLMLGLFIPSLKMESIYPYGTIGQGCMWAEIYYEYPFVYCFMYLLLDGIFAGLLASISTAVAFIVRNKVVTIIAPFFLMLVLDYIDSNYLLKGEFSPIKFMQALPVANDCYGWAVAAIGIVMFVSTFGYVMYKGYHYEVL